ISEIPDGPGDLVLHRLEGGIERRDAGRIQDLLALTVLRHERHFLGAELQLDRVAVHVERSLPDRMIFDPLSAHELGQQSLTVLADRKSTRLNSSHLVISYAVFCLKKKN